MLRKALANAANVLISVERITYNTLHGAPKAIMSGQIGIRGLKERYQELEVQWQRVQQVLALLGLGQNIWRISQSRSAKTRRVVVREPVRLEHLSTSEREVLGIRNKAKARKMPSLLKQMQRSKRKGR